MISILLCEEVRNEMSGTRTLVGVFGPSGLKVKTLPFLLPKFAMFVTSDLKEGFDFSFEILDPKGVLMMKGEMPKVADKSTGVHFGINFSPMVFKEFGKHEFKVFRNDGVGGKTDLEIIQGE